MTCSLSRVQIQSLRILRSSAILILLLMLPSASTRANDDISSGAGKNIETFLTQFCGTAIAMNGLKENCPAVA